MSDTRIDRDEEAPRGAVGHLDDAALAALADGLELAPGQGAHAEACEACAARLAEAALEAEVVGVALRERAARRAEAVALAERASPRLPRWSMALAAALVVVGSLPELSGGARWIAAARVLGALGKRGLRAVVAFAGDPDTALTTGLALMVVGFAVAVVASRLAKDSMERGAKHVA